MALEDLKNRAATIAAGLCASPGRLEMPEEQIAALALAIAQQIEVQVEKGQDTTFKTTPVKWG